MSHPTSHGFGALPVRSWASVVMFSDTLWSRHVFLLVTSVLEVRSAEVEAGLQSVTPVRSKAAAAPYQTFHCAGCIVPTACRVAAGRSAGVRANALVTQANAATAAASDAARR